MYLLYATGGSRSLRSRRVNAETFRHARESFFWITLGAPVYMLGQTLNPVIRSDGSQKFAMASTLAGAAVNIAIGIAAGARPIVGYHSGAKKFGRLARRISAAIEMTGRKIWAMRFPACKPQ